MKIRFPLAMFIALIKRGDALWKNRYRRAGRRSYVALGDGKVLENLQKKKKRKSMER